MLFFKKIKYFRNFVLPFRYLDSISNTFKKQMALIVDVFFNFGTPKNVVKQVSQNSFFR